VTPTWFTSVDILIAEIAQLKDEKLGAFSQHCDFHQSTLIADESHSVGWNLFILHLFSWLFCYEDVYRRESVKIVDTFKSRCKNCWNVLTVWVYIFQYVYNVPGNVFAFIGKSYPLFLFPLSWYMYFCSFPFSVVLGKLERTMRTGDKMKMRMLIFKYKKGENV